MCKNGLFKTQDSSTQERPFHKKDKRFTGYFYQPVKNREKRVPYLEVISLFPIVLNSTALF